MTRLSFIFPVFLLLVVLTLGYPYPSFGLSIDFEGLSDLDSVTTQFAGDGVTFSNATVLTAGISLNELEFPPKSGQNVVFDDGGPLTLLFSASVFSFSGFFTYAAPITVSAFDSGNNLLLTVTSAFSSNLALSGDVGSSPNEQLSLAGVGAIAKITITGDALGGSFVLDDVQATAVPEPSTFLLLGTCLLGFGAYRIRRQRFFLG